MQQATAMALPHQFSWVVLHWEATSGILILLPPQDEGAVHLLMEGPLVIHVLAVFCFELFSEMK